MSRLAFPAPEPQVQPLSGFAQLVSGLVTMLDLLAEVDRLAWQARQRYPLAD